MSATSQVGRRVAVLFALVAVVGVSSSCLGDSNSSSSGGSGGSTSDLVNASWGFQPRAGWHQTGSSTAADGSPGASLSVTNVASASPDLGTAVSQLPADGIIIAATILPPSAPRDPARPGASLAAARAYIRWNNQQPLFKPGVSGQIAFFTVAQEHGTTVFLRIYFGTHRRSPALFNAASRELAALHLPTTNPNAVKTAVTGAAPLVSTPAAALGLCRSDRLLKPACPWLVPVGPYDDFTGPDTIYNLAHIPISPRTPATFSLSWWAENPIAAWANRPPRFLHLVVWAKHGELIRGAGGLEPAFNWPDPRHPLTVKNGAFAADPSHPESFGHATWCGRNGTLTLVAHRDGLGFQAGHLIFRWQDNGTDYAIGLHSWEPFTETAATLRGVVCSMDT